MTQKEMSNDSGIHGVGGCISVLKRLGLMQTIGRGHYKVNVDADTGVDFDDPHIDDMRNNKIGKLNAVMSFFRTRSCRAEYVANYFGDKEFRGPCGICDNCER